MMKQINLLEKTKEIIETSKKTLSDNSIICQTANLASLFLESVKRALEAELQI